MKNDQQINELIEAIRKNVGEILEKDVPMDVLYTNLINRGIQVYMKKDLQLQNAVDLCALCLAVYLNKNKSAY